MESEIINIKQTWFLFSSGGITVGRVLEPDARLTRTKELPAHSLVMEAHVGMGCEKANLLA